MFEYGDKVQYVRTGYIGEIIGFMRGDDKFLVKFPDSKDIERWLSGSSLRLVAKYDEK